MYYSKLIDIEIEHIKSIDIEQVSDLVDWMSTLIINHDPRIITSGMGKAGHMASAFSSTLCSTGISSSFLHPSEAQHGDLGVIRDNDIIFIFSNSGKTSEIIDLVNLIKSIDLNNPIIGILGNTSPYFEEKCQRIIKFGPVKEVCPLGLTPTTSTTCMSIICDLIVSGLTEKRKFTKEQYSKLHHGGYLNLKARGLV